MEEHNMCPACSGSDLQIVGCKDMELIEPPQTTQQGGINAILKSVLNCNSLTVETVLCRKCRHIFLSPTFDELELVRLYSPECFAETNRQYRESERTSGVSWAEENRISPNDQENLLIASNKFRPKRLYELVMDSSPNARIRKVLDFGARTGELTKLFSDECIRFVYDKDLSMVNDTEVIPIDSFEAIQSNGPYDLIVLSHVLEHIPYPTKLLYELSANLATEGLLYVEVPLEYCGTIIKHRGIPIGGHVNYFCRSSLLTCLKSISFRSISIRREVVPYGVCQMPALKAVACKNRSGLFFPQQWLWPIDLIVDTALTIRSRKWPKHFDQQ